MNEILDQLKTWAKHPFTSDMSVAGWFLFFGMLILISFLWSRILVHLSEATKEL